MRQFINENTQKFDLCIFNSEYTLYSLFAPDKALIFYPNESSAVNSSLYDVKYFHATPYSTNWMKKVIAGLDPTALGAEVRTLTTELNQSLQLSRNLNYLK